MAYRLKRQESVRDGLQRVAIEQFDRAEKDLRRSKDAAGIHDARKVMKKLRALLKLVRSDLEPVVFDRENAAFGDIGRRLSPVRDADVLLEAIEKLKPQRSRDQPFSRVVSALQQHRRHVRRDFFADRAALETIRQSVSESRSRLEDWLDRDVGHTAILKGLQRSYRLADASFVAARRSKDAGKWHEWRKRTKDFWYHLRLFHRVWPPMFGATIAQCGELADRLGEEHDWLVLDQRLSAVATESGGPRESKRLHALIVRRRDALREEARTAGSSLFGQKPREFRQRAAACWQTWKA